MNTESKQKKNISGMSRQEIKARLGLVISDRQFRRYIAEGLIPSSWIETNANGHFVFNPPLNTKWGEYRQRIEEWREERYKRGWSWRVRKNADLRPKDKTSGFVTIEGISMKFDLWSRKMFAEMILEWERERFLQLYNLLFKAGCMFLWLEKLCDTDGKLEERRRAMIRQLDEQLETFRPQR